MKYIIYILICLLSPALLEAATPVRVIYKNTNQIIYTKEQGKESIHQKIVYDGFNKPALYIVQMTDSTYKHYPTHMFPGMGISPKTHLPYVAEIDSRGMSRNYETDQEEYYSQKFDDQTPYAYYETEYENSPLCRPTKEYRPGSVNHVAGAEKYTSYDYGLNKSTDLVIMLRMYAEYAYFKMEGYHLPNTLFKTSITNEDGNKTIQFTDQNNNLILKRVINGKEQIDTYFAYDELGRQALQISPKGSAILKKGRDPKILFSDDFARDYCTYCLYDKMGNVIKSHFAGQYNSAIRQYNENGQIIAFCDNNTPLYKKGRDTYMATNRFLFQYDDQSRLVQKRLVRTLAKLSSIIIDSNTPKRPVNPIVKKDYETDTVVLEENPYDLYTNIPSSLQFQAQPDLSSNQPLTNTRDSIANKKQLVVDDVTMVVRKNYEADTVVLEENRYDLYTNIPSSLQFQAQPDLSFNQPLTNTRGLIVYKKQLVVEDTVTLVSRFIERAYYYDTKARIIQSVETNQLGGINRLSYNYDFIGNVTRCIEEVQLPSGIFCKKIDYTYSVQGALLSEITTLDNATPVTTQYHYDDLGTLIAKETNGIVDSLKYNIQGWLTEKKNPYFNMQLKYQDPQFSNNGQFAGNISEWHWDNCRDSNDAYSFTYDKQGQLENSLHYVNGRPSASFTEQDIAHDLHGNITSFQRQLPDKCEKFHVTYIGDRLHKVRDVAPTADEIAPAELDASIELIQNQTSLIRSESFRYDSGGNLLYDPLRELNFRYNYLDLPRRIYTDQTGTSYVKYAYLANGTKISVTDTQGIGTEYIGSFRFVRTPQTGVQLESVTFNGGYFVAQQVSVGLQYAPRYLITDHLGSVRVVVDSDGGVLERNDYYSSGLRWKSPSVPVSSNPYGFNGNEFQTVGSDLIDYGFRMYDPELMHWTGQDKLRQFDSPYQFCGNNPVRFVDPNGLWMRPNQNVISSGYSRGVSDSYGYVLGHNNPFSTFKLGDDTIPIEPVIIIGHPNNIDEWFRKWMDWNQRGGEDDPYGKAMSGATTLIGGGAGVAQIAGSGVNLGSNGKVYVKKPSGNIFRGSGAVTTYNLAKLGKITGIVMSSFGGVIVFSDVFDDFQEGHPVRGYVRTGYAIATMASAKIPYGGPVISMTMGIIDIFYGDEMYQWAEDQILQ